MDVFMEYLIKRKRDVKDNVIVALIIFAGIILTLILFVFLFIMSLALVGSGDTVSQFSSIFFGLGLLVIAAMWYGAYVLINHRSIEFEYILTNSDMDIDKIIAKKGRKRVISFDFKDAELVANINDDEHNHSYKSPVVGTKVYDFTGNKDNENIYFIDITIESERTQILFQPTLKMLESIKKFNPRKVFIKSDY